MTNKNQFKDLKDFFAGYFHQDWAVEGHTPDEVISLYLDRERNPDKLRELADQICQFVNYYSDEALLERSLFSELGCYYRPRSPKMTTRAWLRHVASTLREAAEKAT